ncbi:hypothetical protein PF002_g29875 [Phytophthora fragariae]|uniref:HAT C-terminal dimerisation domain-containing protein n=2 Tax=Phytophthora fragariae TaxID=53985 RepID=A0A6A3DHU6_9STRA|nr:hypothetical protein PF009_g29853 [Phytophthora fragariae]KAE9171226.1 hypothetical protein PF002_g29875 [Phytophthora fragariae]
MTYALLPTGARHDALAIAEQMEEVMEQMANDGWKVGAVITDNAGQCGRARRILSLRYPRISFQICFAHDLNNLVKAVLKSDFSVVTKEASDAVNALNASSAKWLVEARTSMADTYGYFLSLKQLCETRWNSMHGCFASLLRVKSALELLEFKFRDAADFPDAVRVFRSASFWARLKDAEEVVRPLSFASLKLQRDENSLADVVVCYLDIFMGFSARAVGTRNLIREVERRWNQCEQLLMLLALFLHPVHMKAGQKLLNKTPHTTIGSLCQIGVYYFRRFTGENPGSLGEHLYNWLKGKLALPPEGGFSSVNTFWDFMRDDMPGSKLPTLAMLVLSIVVNTATCERYFSELALIHTAKRNKMSVEKARKIAAIRKKVRESDHLDEILKSDRIKKLTNPTERRRRQDDRFECNQADAEEESDGETGSDLGSDDAFEYWGAVLAGLEEDEDLSPSYSRAVSSNGAAVARSTDSIHNRDNSSSSTPDRGQNAAAERAREEREFREKISEIAEQATEAIPEPIKHPFPAFNDRNFPQEIFLTGLRGQKISLAELCQASQVTSEDPVWHFASPVRFNQVVHR